MEFFTGLDVGMDETAVCVVDDKGKVMLQTTVVTDPEAIKLALKPYLGRLRRVGHEAGSWSPCSIRNWKSENLCPTVRKEGALQKWTNEHVSSDQFDCGHRAHDGNKHPTRYPTCTFGHS